jgi:acyl dehydratase
MKYKKGDRLENWSFTVTQENMNLWAEILDDPNPIHLDVNSVKLLGLGEKTINQGHANIAYIINAINHNFPDSEIIKLNNKMTDSILEGDKITVSGQINNIIEESNKLIINCKLQLNVGQEKISVVSEADILIKV